MFVCLLDELFLGFFVTAILHGKLVDLNLAITLVLQANQLTNCAKLQVYDDICLQVSFESHCCCK